MPEVSHFEKDTNNEQRKIPKTANKSISTRILDSSNEQSSVGKGPYHKLFSFVDLANYALMVIGAITTVGSGLCLPLMTLVFGELANSFGQNGETKSVVAEVSKVLCIIAYLKKEST